MHGQCLLLQTLLHPLFLLCFLSVVNFLAN